MCANTKFDNRKEVVEVWKNYTKPYKGGVNCWYDEFDAYDHDFCHIDAECCEAVASLWGQLESEIFN